MWLLGLMLGGCDDQEFDGVAVGNPTITARLAETEGVTLTLARTRVKAEFVACESGATTVVELGEVDLVQLFRFTGPPGLSCEVRVSSVGAVQVSGNGAGGALHATFTPIDVTFMLEPVDAVGRAPFYGVELGATDWLGVLADDLATDDVRLNPSSPEYDALVGSLVTGSGLYLDDGNGLLSDAERATGLLVSGDP